MATTEQMLSKEALVECPVTGKQSRPNERYVCPALEAIAVTIGAVLHDVTSMYLLLLIYLPKDDAATAGGTNEVVIIDILKPVR